MKNKTYRALLSVTVLTAAMLVSGCGASNAETAESNTVMEESVSEETAESEPEAQASSETEQETDEEDYLVLNMGENWDIAQDGVDNKLVFTPEESGYYLFDLYCIDDWYGTAAITSVLKDDGEEILCAYNFCYLEKGSTYSITYGVYEIETEETRVLIDTEAYDLEEIETAGVIKTHKNLILHYQAESNDDVLVYSVSEGDPSAIVFNEEFDIIAENSDADGEFSDNDHDFAMLVPVEEGNGYLIMVDNTEGKECEIHLLPSSEY